MKAPESMQSRLPTKNVGREGSTSLPKWPSWFLLVWWILILGIVELPVADDAGSTASAVESGSLTRTLLVLTFGAVGALMLPWGIKRLDRAGWRFLAVLGAYLAWSALSFVWSDAPQLTIRRLVLAALLVVGAFGLGTGYYGRSENGRAVLVRDLLLAGMIAAISAWIAALGNGGVDVLAGDWELVPVAVGTSIGYPVLLTALVSIFGRHTSAIPHPFASRRALGGVLIGALTTIVSLRKRTLLAVTIPATALLSLLFRRRRSRRTMLLRLGVGLLLAAIVITFVGSGFAERVSPIFLRGEQELDLESLSGRIPLWEELAGRAAERPLTGVGYGAFWEPERMADVQSSVLWPAVTAHNGYIDEILATGLPGLVLMLGVWATALGALITRVSKNRDAFALLTAVWIGCYLLLNLTESLMQNLLRFPFYSALVLAFASFSTRSSTDASSV